MRYIILLLFLTLFLSACENVRHKVGVSAKPFATDGKFEDSAKINYTIIFGTVRLNDIIRSKTL